MRAALQIDVKIDIIEHIEGLQPDLKAKANDAIEAIENEAMAKAVVGANYIYKANFKVGIATGRA